MTEYQFESAELFLSNLYFLIFKRADCCLLNLFEDFFTKTFHFRFPQYDIIITFTNLAFDNWIDCRFFSHDHFLDRGFIGILANKLAVKIKHIIWNSESLLYEAYLSEFPLWIIKLNLVSLDSDYKSLEIHNLILNHCSEFLKT